MLQARFCRNGDTTLSARTTSSQAFARICSLGAGDVDVEALHGGADTADDFGGPECFAEQRHPAVFGLADGAKSVTFVRGLVRIEAAPREFGFDHGVRPFDCGAGAHSE